MASVAEGFCGEEESMPFSPFSSVHGSYVEEAGSLRIPRIHQRTSGEELLRHRSAFADTVPVEFSGRKRLEPKIAPASAVFFIEREASLLKRDNCCDSFRAKDIFAPLRN